MRVELKVLLFFASVIALACCQSPTGQSVSNTVGPTSGAGAGAGTGAQLGPVTGTLVHNLMSSPRSRLLLMSDPDLFSELVDCVQKGNKVSLNPFLGMVAGSQFGQSQGKRITNLCTIKELSRDFMNPLARLI